MNFDAQGKPVSAAIGVFDGVHLGHQSVLVSAQEAAAARNGFSLAMTFDVHPASVLAPAHAPPLIYPLDEKRRVLSLNGMDAVHVFSFTREFSQLTPEEFVTRLCDSFPTLCSLSVGGDFNFGRGRSGNVRVLAELWRKHHFEVKAVPACFADGKIVSSTRIRHEIQSGNFHEASKLLGRRYELCGEVVEGKKMGRTLGFPTANLKTDGLALPPNGVYVARVVEDEKVYPAVLNVGVRPTVDGEASKPSPVVEVHIFDFDKNLYGRRLRVRFGPKLREERKFESLDALRAQITRDANEARTIHRLLPHGVSA